MNTPNPALRIEIDTLRAVLALCAIVPRPIPYPQTSATTVIGGRR